MGYLGCFVGLIILGLAYFILTYKDRKRKREHYKNIAEAKANSRNFKEYSTKYY